MKSTAENLSPTRVRLSVEVPFEELQPSLDAAYKKIGAQIRIPGFRPGKVPARIIDQRVGRAAVLEEAVNEVVPRKYIEAAREHELKALGQPDINVTTDVAAFTENEPLSFTAEVDVRPEIELPDLDGHRRQRRRRRGERRRRRRAARIAAGALRQPEGRRARRADRRLRVASTSARRSTAPRSRPARPRACPTRSVPVIWSTGSTTRWSVPTRATR